MKPRRPGTAPRAFLYGEAHAEKLFRFAVLAGGAERRTGSPHAGRGEAFRVRLGSWPGGSPLLSGGDFLYFNPSSTRFVRGFSCRVFAVFFQA